LPDLVLDYHRRRVPIDHPDLSVTRAKLEYVTVNVALGYLSVIGKTTFGGDRWSASLLTVDSFTDRRLWSVGRVGSDWYDAIFIARYAGPINHYHTILNNVPATADHKIRKVVAGSITDLAREAVDLTTHHTFHVAFEVSGSTLKSWRTNRAPDWGVPTITATDTTFASGPFGACYGTIAEATLILPPASPAPGAVAILEVEVGGSGAYEDPFTPLLSRSVVEDKWDLDSVSWGAFEFSEKSPTNIITIQGDNQHKPGAVQRQVEFTRRRGLRVFTPPRGYSEAVELYRTLKKDFPHWLAGKDSFAYQILGWDVLDMFQNIDFYYGELVEHRMHYDQLKQVPGWELRRRLEELRERLRRVTVLVEERDKHLRKIEEVLRRGW